MNEFTVKITPFEATNIIINEIVNGSLSGKLVDKYILNENCLECVVLVFEKYFMRNSGRAGLTVIISNIGGITTIHSVGSAGGQGAFFGFDWGAANNFANSVELALEKYKKI